MTAQQRDIERQILKGIRTKHSGYYWFSGLPGTGKTLLLLDRALSQRLAGLPDVQSFHLTNRIRTNAELSSFIQNMMDLSRRKGQKRYPNIEVVCANDDTEAACLLRGYTRRGYLYQTGDVQISADPAKGVQINDSQVNAVKTNGGKAKIANSAVRDVSRLVVVLDERYYYDGNGYLRARKICEDAYETTCTTTCRDSKSDVRVLFHQLNQAKEKLAIVIKDNPAVYDTILNLLQMRKNR